MTTTIKRKHERHTTSEAVNLRVDHWSGLHAHCHNVSYGGIGLVLPHKVDRGDKLYFDLVLPRVGKVTLEARVRHVTELSDGQFAAGLQWHLPTDQDRHVVRDFVDQQNTAAVAA